MKMSKTLATCGRILLCYSYMFGTKPRPAVVSDGRILQTEEDGTIENTASVNLLLVAGTDTPVGDFNMIHDLGVFDALTEDERSEKRIRGETWLEWPAIPQQKPAGGDLLQRIEQLEQCLTMASETHLQLAMQNTRLIDAVNRLGGHVEPPVNLKQEEINMKWPKIGRKSHPNDPPKNAAEEDEVPPAKPGEKLLEAMNPNTRPFPNQ